MSPIIVIVLTQILFTASDLWARSMMVRHGFHLATFITPWFLGYTVLRFVATFGQLYVLSNMKLGSTMAIFGAMSIIIANALGFLVLKEVLSPMAYIGVSCTVVAFIVLAFR